MEEMDFSGYSTAIGGFIESTKNDFVEKLEDLQSDSRSIGYYNNNYADWVNEIEDVTFASLDKAFDIVSNIQFTPVEERSLVDGEYDSILTHVFESVDLDTAENNIVDFISASGNTAIKELNASAISDVFRQSLVSGKNLNRVTELNRSREILEKYATPDLSANTEWLDLISSFVEMDQLKKVYESLFALAQKHAQWATSKAISIEEMHANFTSKYNSLILTIVDANIAAYRAEVLANIASLENETRKMDAETDITGIKLDLISKEAELKLEQYSSRLAAFGSHYSSLVAANLKMLEVRMKGVQNVADGYKSIFASYASSYTGISIGRQ